MTNINLSDQMEQIHLEIDSNVIVNKVELEWFSNDKEQLPLPIININKYPKHKVYKRISLPQHYSTLYISAHEQSGLIDAYIDINNNNNGFGGKELTLNALDQNTEEIKEYKLSGPYRAYQFNKGYKVLREGVKEDIVECGLISDGIKSRGFIFLSKIKEYIDLPFVEIKDRSGIKVPSLSKDFILKPDNSLLIGT